MFSGKPPEKVFYIGLLWEKAAERYPGVTAELIVRHALDAGVTVRRREATLADLHGRETWLTNALHGIRPLTAWVGSPCRPGPAERLPRWRQVLASLARPLPDPPAPEGADDAASAGPRHRHADSAADLRRYRGAAQYPWGAHWTTSSGGSRDEETSPCTSPLPVPPGTSGP